MDWRGGDGIHFPEPFEDLAGALVELAVPILVCRWLMLASISERPPRRLST